MMDVTPLLLPVCDKETRKGEMCYKGNVVLTVFNNRGQAKNGKRICYEGNALLRQAGKLNNALPS